MLQFHGGELVLQCLQAALPSELEAGLARTPAIGLRLLRQQIQQPFHLPLRGRRQRLELGNQSFATHNRLNVAIESAVFNLESSFGRDGLSAALH